MEYFKIDADKLNKKIEEKSKIRDEAFTEFGRAYIYQGNHNAHTADRKKHACLMAGCVTGLENIRAFLDVYNENNEKFTSAHELAQKDILKYKENSQQYFVAEGMEMAFRTVLSNCLVDIQQDKNVSAESGERYFMMDVDGIDCLVLGKESNTQEYATEMFFMKFGYYPDIVKVLDEQGSTLEVIKDVRDDYDISFEKKYYEVDLVNYDENNVPYIVATVHFASTNQPDKDEVADFCRDNFEYDFEEVFSIEKTTLDEVLEYVNKAEIPTFDNCFNDIVDKLVNNATQRSKGQWVDSNKSDVEFEKE